MTTPSTRWEWRTFGRALGPPGGAAPRLEPGGVEERDELYLLGPEAQDDAAGPVAHNVKVREGRLDIKLLRQVDAVGLERWEPVLDAAFPVPAVEVAAAFEASGAPPPPLGRSRYTLEQFLTELVEPSTAWRAVAVHKRRVRFGGGDWSAELADVDSGGRATRTLAVEGEDPAAVWAAVKGFGLAGRVNTSFPRGLAQLVDGVPARYAVIDCGTSSIKFHLAERRADGSWAAIVDRAEITRLGQGLDQTGRISGEAVERAVTAIRSMLDEAQRRHARARAAVGTAWLRRAGNGDEVVRALEEATGLEVLVVSGEDESRLAYQAVSQALGPIVGPVVVFDTGGGSSQFTFGVGGTVHERFSVDVGALAYTERFGLAGAVGAEVLQAALGAIAQDLGRLDGRPAPDVLVGMGGTVTNLTAVQLGLADYDPGRVEGATLDRAEVDRQIELYRTRGADARRAVVGLQPDRANVILAGACIVRTVLDKLGVDRLTVSDRGLRHGLLVERFADAPD